MSRRIARSRRGKQDAVWLLAVGGAVLFAERNRWGPLLAARAVDLPLLGVVAGGLLLVALGGAWRRQRQQARSLALLQDADRLRHLNGVAFEHALQAVFQRQGYRVGLTPGSGDFGADLILHRGGQATVVQAKRYQDRVGVHAVQEVIAAREYYQAHAALVVTTATYTHAARELAARTGVTLWDGAHLAAAVQTVHQPQQKGDSA